MEPEVTDAEAYWKVNPEGKNQQTPQVRRKGMFFILNSHRKNMGPNRRKNPVYDGRKESSSRRVRAAKHARLENRAKVVSPPSLLAFPARGLHDGVDTDACEVGGAGRGRTERAGGS
jgi:hypothetical protein